MRTATITITAAINEEGAVKLITDNHDSCSLIEAIGMMQLAINNLLGEKYQVINKSEVTTPHKDEQKPTCIHRYSRSMNQSYPRKCINCGEAESTPNN